MEMYSFSHLMANLFLGLCKEARVLRPYSTQFAKQLGYTNIRLESSFKSVTAQRRVNPDAIISSRSLGNILILEWTAASDGNDKEDQLLRYSRVGQADLTDLLAIPPREAQTFDVVLIVIPRAQSSFSEVMAKRGWQFPLLVFRYKDAPFTLIKVENRCRLSETDDFFANGLSLDKIPLRYLPFPLDDISPRRLVSHVVQHLVALLVKGEEIVTIEEFCAGFIPVWRVIEPRKRSDISKATRAVLKYLSNEKFGRNLLTREPGEPPTWRLGDQANFQRYMRSYRSDLDRFIAKQQGRGYQLELEM